MMMSQKGKIICILALMSVCHLMQSASCKPHMRQSYPPIDVPEETKKLIRVKLLSNNGPYSFEAISQSHRKIHNLVEENLEETDPHYSLNPQMVGIVGIGNPVQEFRLMFDTSYPNVWVTSTKCKNCAGHRLYNSSASTTYVENGTVISIGWDDGVLSGDQLVFGDTIIKKQIFTEMLTINKAYINTPIDGAFCLGLDESAGGDVVTPLRNMVELNLIEREIFSIYKNSSAGEIVFGGTDSNHYDGTINWVPNADVIAWSFMIEYFAVNGTNDNSSDEVRVCDNSCQLDISTGMNYIMGPPEQVKTLNEAMGAHVDEDDETMFDMPDCDLSRLSNLVLKINSQRYELRPEQYIGEVKKGDKVICISLLFAHNLPFPDYWMVGSPLIGNIYIVFDYENRSLGFARSK